MKSRDVLVGFGLGVLITWGASFFAIATTDARIAQLNARADSLTAQHTADSLRADSSLKQQAVHDAVADTASRRASRINLGAVVKIIPAVCVTPDSTRQGATIAMVPLDTAMAWKNAWEAEQTARLHAIRVLIPDLQAQLATSRSQYENALAGNRARDQKVHALERQKRIGVVGVVATVLLISVVIR